MQIVKQNSIIVEARETLKHVEQQVRVEIPTFLVSLRSSLIRTVSNRTPSRDFQRAERTGVPQTKAQ